MPSNEIVPAKFGYILDDMLPPPSGQGTAVVKDPAIGNDRLKRALRGNSMGWGGTMFRSLQP